MVVIIFAATGCQSIGLLLASVSRRAIAGWAAKGIPPFQRRRPPIKVRTRQIAAGHGGQKFNGLLEVLLLTIGGVRLSIEHQIL